MFSRAASYDGFAVRRSWLPTSDRGSAVLLLCVPLALGLICLLGAITVTLMGPMAQGSLRFGLGVFFYAGVAWCTLCAPWYAAGVIGLAWWTKRYGGAEASAQVVLRSLWRMPLATSALAWFPYAFVIPPMHASRFQLCVLLVLAQLVTGYLWAAITRGGLRFWQGV